MTRMQEAWLNYTDCGFRTSIDFNPCRTRINVRGTMQLLNIQSREANWVFNCMDFNPCQTWQERRRHQLLSIELIERSYLSIEEPVTRSTISWWASLRASSDTLPWSYIIGKFKLSLFVIFANPPGQRPLISLMIELWGFSSCGFTLPVRRHSSVDG